MKIRKLGASGPELPALGYGAMSIGNAWGDIDDQGAAALLSALVDHGIQHVDAANIYGQGLAESRIGAWIAKNGQKFHLATKASFMQLPDGSRGIDNSYEHLSSELEKSLKRLNVEAVDLFYAHRRQPGLPPEALGEALDKIKRSGKAKAVGLSEVAPTTLAAVHQVTEVAAVQSEYSLATRAVELGLVQRCAELGVALVAFSPVGRGLLTDQPPSAEMAQANFFFATNPRFQPGALARNTAFLAPLRAYARDLGLSLAGLATAWTVARGEHLFSIPGTRSKAHLAELVTGATRGLSASEISEIEALAPLGWCEGERYSKAQWIGPETFG